MDAMLFEVAIERAVINTATADLKTLMQLSNADQTRENSRWLSTKIWAGANSMRLGESRRERMRV